MKNKIITIDGPVASGKSSLARALAEKLGYFHINSGFLYRAIAYIFLHECGKTVADLRVLSKDDEGCIDKQQLVYEFHEDGPRIIYKGIDITSQLKTREMDDASSIVSTHQFVRELVNYFQHILAANHNIVIDGRDIGSVVFPDAQLKIFLTASLDERALRWQSDQRQLGKIYTMDQAMQEVYERDRRDTQRIIAPLRVPTGALVIDNTGLTLDQSIDMALKHFIV
jgi:cytidylate kinase